MHIHIDGSETRLQMLALAGMLRTLAGEIVHEDRPDVGMVPGALPPGTSLSADLKKFTFPTSEIAGSPLLPPVVTVVNHSPEPVGARVVQTAARPGEQVDANGEITQLTPDPAKLFGSAPALVIPTLGVPPAPPVPRPPAAPAVPVAPQPPSPGPGVEVDRSGIPWDARIHGSTKTKNQDGTWRAKRGLNDPALVQQVEGELRRLMAIAQVAGTTPPMPPAPPAVPVAPPQPPAAPAPLPPSPPTPPATDAPTTFPALMQLLLPLISQHKLTDAAIIETARGIGIEGDGGLALLATVPIMIPKFYEEVMKRVTP